MNTNLFQPTSIRTIISNGHYFHGTWNLDMKIDLTSTQKATKHSELTRMFARCDVKAKKCQIESTMDIKKNDQYARDRVSWGEKELGLLLKTELVWVFSAVSGDLCRGQTLKVLGLKKKKVIGFHEIGDRDLRLKIQA